MIKKEESSMKKEENLINKEESSMKKKDDSIKNEQEQISKDDVRISKGILESEGKVASVRNIREHLGSGSFKTIQKYLYELNNEEMQQSALLCQFNIKEDELKVKAILFLNEIVKAILDESNKYLQTFTDSNMRAYTAQADDLSDAYEEIKSKDEEINKLKETLKQQEATISKLTKDVNEKKSELSAQKELYKALEKINKDLEKKIDKLNEGLVSIVNKIK